MSVSYQVIQPGDGQHRVQPGDTVSVHYTTSLSDGRVFDTSKLRGSPFRFIVGTGTVVNAWDEVLPKMCLGERVVITSSAEAAYGPRGLPGIPGGSTIRFEVELLAIHNQA